MEQKTKEKIYDFGLSYLKNNDTQHLTFSMISKNTGISRTTLYNHYGNIDDILDEIGEYYNHPLEKELLSYPKKTNGCYLPL